VTNAPSKLPTAFVILGLALFPAFCLWAMRANSVCYDERTHLQSGLAHLTRGALYTQRPAPLDPLAAATSAWNAAWVCLRTGDPRGELYFFSRAQTLAAREANLWMGLAIGAALVVVSVRLWGPWGGALTAVSYAFTPAFIAHASILSTDLHAAALSLLVVLILWRAIHRPTPVTGALLGVALALALACKLLLVILIPIIGMALIYRKHFIGGDAGAPRIQWTTWGVFVSALVVACFVAAWGIHQWSQLGDPRSPWGVSLSRWGAIVQTATELRGGNRLRYFNGELGRHSWLFMPVALLVKTPLPLLALATLSIAAGLLERRSPRNGDAPAGGSAPLQPVTGETNPSPDDELGAVERPKARDRRPAPLAFAAMASAIYLIGVELSKTQLGSRHALPAMLFLPLAIGGLAGRRLWRRRGFRAAGVAGLVWLAVGTARVMPFPIANFNELAGGPNGGHRWLVDSDLDWGQGLHALKRWQDGRPETRPLLLAYFGQQTPEEAGLEYEGLPSPFSPVTTDEKWLHLRRFPEEARGWIAVSETLLKGVYNQECGLPPDYYSGLENEPIVARIAYSIRVIHRP